MVHFYINDTENSEIRIYKQLDPETDELVTTITYGQLPLISESDAVRISDGICQLLSGTIEEFKL